MMEIEDPADLSPNDDSPVEETDFMIPAHTPMGHGIPDGLLQPAELLGGASDCICCEFACCSDLDSGPEMKKDELLGDPRIYMCTWTCVPTFGLYSTTFLYGCFAGMLMSPSTRGTPIQLALHNLSTAICAWCLFRGVEEPKPLCTCKFPRPCVWSLKCFGALCCCPSYCPVLCAQWLFETPIHPCPPCCAWRIKEDVADESAVVGTFSASRHTQGR
mmetsp:Transcript_22715/g.40182  ORF Transcript_22715/g.40182 Transcript_22715/m.40182 type:complete len:217 (+) Transcript_22715:81-731(+)